MEANQKYQRPTFEVALHEWKQILTARGLSADCEWILDENLVFERDPAAPASVRLSYQTRFTQRPENLAEAAYQFFADFTARIAFYRIGACHGKSICLLLCDPVFETRGESDGFIRRDDWSISFCPGNGQNLEEITDEQRWKNRLVSGRPLTDVDFCVPLTVLRELEAHGRVLNPNERFGVRIVDAWRRWQRSSEV
jgi:hypothetical protein